MQCRQGGPSFGDNGNAPKLIIPGQSSPGGGSPRPGGSLIIPGSPGGGAPSGSSAGGLASGDAPVLQNFRPPPGFMDADAGAQTEINADPQEMLNRLQAQAGHWHQLAKLFPALLAKGYDSNVVEEMTGIERKLQNIWSSSAQIYESLKKTGVPPEVMAHFDGAGGEHLLYELRFLTNQQRKAAAAYIAEHDLDAAMCLVLGRAIKEHERRNGIKEGFMDTPADCLAYKYYRDAMESRRQEDIEKYVNKALSVVESDTARAKLEGALGGAEAAAAQTLPQAQLTGLRLTKEEVGYRPIPLVGNLADAHVDALVCPPKVNSTGGVFGNFSIPEGTGTTEWIPLPAWSILALAKRPAALFVPNCADLEAVRGTSAAKTQDDMKKLAGPGLIIVDAEGEEVEADPNTYYLAAGAGGKVELLTGAQLEGKRIIGPVLFLCRPPARESMAATTAELLSL